MKTIMHQDTPVMQSTLVQNLCCIIMHYCNMSPKCGITTYILSQLYYCIVYTVYTIPMTEIYFPVRNPELVSCINN
jgi:hypothetical protein